MKCPVFVKFIELLDPQCKEINFFRNVINPLATDRGKIPEKWNLQK
jgi:phage FluMu protein Com